MSLEFGHVFLHRITVVYSTRSYKRKKMTASDWLAIMIGHQAGSSIFRIVFNLLLLSSFACFMGGAAKGNN
jgi:hypothetical protein